MTDDLLFIQRPGDSLATLPRFNDGPERLEITHILHAYIDQDVPFNTAVQEVTFETLRRAAAFGDAHVSVTHFVVTFPEERHLVPDHCVPVPELRRTVTDLANFKVARPLPLLFDVLRLGIEAARRSKAASGHDRFVICTNSDIHVQPYFYDAVAALVRMGYDMITINRRTIGKVAPSLPLPLMYGDGGRDHPGYDCFVFPLRLFDEFLPTDSCIGAGHVMRSLLYNMAAFGRRFAMLATPHLTFHIGDDGAWRNPDYKDYIDFNFKQSLDLATRLAAAPTRAARLFKFVQENGENRAIVDRVAVAGGLQLRPHWRQALRQALKFRASKGG